MHPAAELLPMMPEAELEEPADQIARNGLQEPIVTWIDNTAEKEGDASVAEWEYPEWLLDGRNRLEALDRRGADLSTVRRVGNAAKAAQHWEATGPVLTFKAWEREGGRKHGAWIAGIDPYQFVMNANLLRRHLTFTLRASSGAT